MHDGVTRRLLKRVARVCYGIDLGFTRLVARVRGESFYVLRGSCRRCGGCCETPMVRTHAVFFYAKVSRGLFLWWHRTVNGLELIHEDRKGRTFTFRCTHWDPQTKLCDSYDSRPGMCRDYPRVLLEVANPGFLPECGHRALHRDAARIRESLADLDLPPAEKAELERRLRARE
ncbi:MAG: hypothetical protein A3K19_21475 [Lentisphaerae bacterium RIFOXYB12_FULL_65_16]|nr:MAG: hypothetical protein A3K18_34150 [Lentisphaerae bacterium RIFOXYA12_64_32]OGV93702.1 MAG: hypothetical protein A3K19_21475 [Lentisphaerae bacterium RIFOXYB12_FULL_65_16]